MDSSTNRTEFRHVDFVFGCGIERSQLNHRDWNNVLLNAWNDIRGEFFHIHGLQDLNTFQQKAVERRMDYNYEREPSLSGVPIEAPTDLVVKKEHFIHISLLPTPPIFGKAVCICELVITRSSRILCFIAEYDIKSCSRVWWMPKYLIKKIRLSDVSFDELPLTSKLLVQNKYKPTENVETPLGGLILNGLDQCFQDTMKSLRQHEEHLHKKSISMHEMRSRLTRY